MNVLVALLDENHTHNSAAETWLAGNIHHGWASCPLTQNGCVRILSQPAYPNTLSVADVVMRLRTAISGPYHRFLATASAFWMMRFVERVPGAGGQTPTQKPSRRGSPAPPSTSPRRSAVCAPPKNTLRSSHTW